MIKIDNIFSSSSPQPYNTSYLEIYYSDNEGKHGGLIDLNGETKEEWMSF